MLKSGIQCVVMIAAGTAPVAAQTASDAAVLLREAQGQALPPTRGGESVTVAAPVAGVPVASASTEAIVIGAITVEGADEIARAAFAPVIAPFLGRTATTADLAAVAQAVADIARRQGYAFATASVPPQTVRAGTVAVRIDEGRLLAVRITGSDSQRLRRTLEKLVGGPVSRSLLERQLLLADDIPSVEIISTRFVREDGGGVLLVEARARRSDGYGTLDNSGSDRIGPVRLRLRYDLTGIIGDDELSVQLVATPLAPKQLAFAAARYAVAVGTSGTQVGVALAGGRAQPKDFPIESYTYSAGVFISTPLVRSNAWSAWFNGDVTLSRIEGRFEGFRVQRDATVVATGSLYATAKTRGGRVSGSIGVAQGLGLAEATRGGDIYASRLDGDGVFTKVFAWGSWTQGLGGGFQMRLAASGQIADRPLLAAQELSIGGPAYGRAYDFNERFGDEGVLGSAELRWRGDGPIHMIDWVEPYGFVDGGHVRKLDGSFGGGELASVGGGVRAALGKFEVAVEGAAPVAVDARGVQGRKPRLNVSLGRKF